MNPEQHVEAASQGYWYGDDDPVTEILSALRAFRRADQELRRRLSAEMGMNVTDLQAIQHVIAAERAGVAVTPRDLTAHLRISTASTTKLLDRLVESGHLTRRPNPHDRRSVVIVATDHAHREVRDRLTRMHAWMREVAAGVPPESRHAVVTFLREMAARLEAETPPEPLTPAPA
ncbi:MarR family winged helix-turn-helix transcriptional regulator [Pseudactinotalea suaedae]|uniref:MarR family winged helix-turn-helix transcriptional regulator n=1 Tax=Pseudactinotalea suaedae TaxID=1524924 RepID=UPI0014794784|nr:MarR family winged helix-turn-helix transcriptional regulator [Pseudactinotalea suaedae]